MTQPSPVSFLSASYFPFPFRCFPGSSPKASPCTSVLVSVSASEGIWIRNLPLFLQKVPLVGCGLDILLRMNPQIHQLGHCPPNFSRCSAPLRLSPLYGPKTFICWSSSSRGPAEWSSPSSVSRELAAQGDAQNVGLFLCHPQATCYLGNGNSIKIE